MTSSASPAPFEELAALRARVQQFESQIVERDALLEHRATTIARHEATIEQRDARIEQLQEQVPPPFRKCVWMRYRLDKAREIERKRRDGDRDIAAGR